MATGPMAKPKRSGGPQTEEGKKASSKNALKSGAYSSTLILPGEDESQYRQIEEQFVRDFQPQDMAEITMVRDLAVLAWKKIRLENLELRVTLTKLNAPLDRIDKMDTEFINSNLINQYLKDPAYYTEKLALKMQKALAFAEQLQKNGVSETDLEDLDIKCLPLQTLLTEKTLDFEISNLTAKEILSWEIQNSQGEKKLFWDYLLELAIQQFYEVTWIAIHRNDIERELQEVKDRRLMALMQNEKPSRAFDDLRRNFYRTLSELRKHQEWKRKMQVIDVASKEITHRD